MPCCVRRCWSSLAVALAACRTPHLQGCYCWSETAVGLTPPPGQHQQDTCDQQGKPGSSQYPELPASASNGRQGRAAHITLKNEAWGNGHAGCSPSPEVA